MESGKTKGLLSVIVPVYKVEQYLDRCVESIVNQTYQNLEIILVDDGSPDKCPELCDQWAKRESGSYIRKMEGCLTRAMLESRRRRESIWRLWTAMIILTEKCMRQCSLP